MPDWRRRGHGGGCIEGPAPVRGGEACRRLLSLRLPAAPVGLPPSRRAAATTSPLGRRVTHGDTLARQVARRTMLSGAAPAGIGLAGWADAAPDGTCVADGATAVLIDSCGSRGTVRRRHACAPAGMRVAGWAHTATIGMGPAEGVAAERIGG